MKLPILSVIFNFFILFAHSQVTTTKIVNPHPKSYKDPDSNSVYTFVEHNPEFLGGDAGLITFLKSNIHYPLDSSKEEGRVLLRFVVNEKGKVQNVEVTQSASKKLDAEAVRVVKMLPDFLPARTGGKPVKVYFNLPIVFQLPK